jgi:thioredoxin 1
MSTLHVDDVNFTEEVAGSKTPVLVDFYADWCGPCRMIGPVIEELAGKYSGKLKVCKVNVDQAGAVAQKYGISSIPTVILFKNGKPVDQFLGALPKQMIENFIEKNL